MINPSNQQASILTIFVGGPFSSALTFEDGKITGFDPHLREKFTLIHNLVEMLGYNLLSSHKAEKFGNEVQENYLVKRDNTWLRRSDLYLALLPLDQNGECYRTDGTCVEIGLAIGRGIPVMLIIEGRDNPHWSYYIRNLDSEAQVVCFDWEEFQTKPEEILNQGISELQIRPHVVTEERKDVTDPYEVIAHHEAHNNRAHLATVRGVELSVYPGVFSPAYSLSSTFLVETWAIPSGAKVLDLGCGSGVLGVIALLDGASFLTAVDINPTAVQNTIENLRLKNLHEKAQVVQGDVFENVAGEYDVIVSNPPFWNRKARNSLELACFDEGYHFLQAMFSEARSYLTPQGCMYIVFSDQGDVNYLLSLAQQNGFLIGEQHLMRPTSDGGHIRIVWKFVQRAT